MTHTLRSLPWAVFVVGTLGGLGVSRFTSPVTARRAAIAVASLLLALAFVLALGAHAQPGAQVSDVSGSVGVDALSLLLLPLTALLGWTLVLAAPGVWASSTALGRLVLNVGLVSTAFVVRDTRAFAVLWVATLLPPWIELRRAPQAEAAARVYALYAGASAISFLAGLVLIGAPLTRAADLWNVHAWATDAGAAPTIGVVALLTAISIRKASLPFHSWLPRVFEAAPPGPMLLLVAPMIGAYAFVRFAVPVLGDLLGDRGFILAPIALLTAAYAAGLAFVQRGLRPVVAWIATSQSALVLVGLECPEGAGLTGGVLVWLSAAAGMTGLGLSAWMLEARFGALDVVRPRGLYRRCRALAHVFLLSGLSLVGLPGTIGFASGDLLLSAVLHSFPFMSLLLFFAVALNGFTLLRTYMRLFHGPPARGVELSLLPREWLALLVPLALVLSQGLYPGPLVRLGAEASQSLLARANRR